MSKPGLSFGLSLGKKIGASKPAPAKRKAFGGDDSDDDAPKSGTKVETLDELGGFDLDSSSSRQETGSRKPKNNKTKLPTHPPTSKTQKQESAMFGDLSSSLASKKHAEEAEELDPSVYDYDGVYESFKPQKKETQQDVERKPKYMKSLLEAASVRKRDALIAEEKKIAREREAEGEEYADKEKFVTEAYKKQQEENRRIEEEEKRREEEEAKKNKTGGMSAFYKNLLNKGEERHAEVLKAAEDKTKSGPTPAPEEDDAGKEKSEAEIAKEINEKGGSVAVNEEGQVVDKRQLLKGGLNVNTKKEAQVRQEAARPKDSRPQRSSGTGFVGSGGKGAMRERQTRMLEAQLEAALKRSREEEEAEREKVERVTKTRKTEGEISSAKERYLARKREAEAAKRKGLAE
ncbi:hypothetical protein LY76DRAFT_560989 [Colletotrichum caudatum]|nr:hypothetical protein LY76DRAFT_560989 [Colletotrichum caudatum]